MYSIYSVYATICTNSNKTGLWWWMAVTLCCLVFWSLSDRQSWGRSLFCFGQIWPIYNLNGWRGTWRMLQSRLWPERHMPLVHELTCTPTHMHTYTLCSFWVWFSIHFLRYMLYILYYIFSAFSLQLLCLILYIHVKHYFETLFTAKECWTKNLVVKNVFCANLIAARTDRSILTGNTEVRGRRWTQPEHESP